MTTHYETADAERVSITLDTPLNEIGEDHLGPGEYALTVDYGEVFYIKGTPATLTNVARMFTLCAERAVAHSQAPLQPNDFEWDADDSMYVCPRCEDGMFEPPAYDDYQGLMDAIAAHITEHEKQAGR